MVLIYTTKMFFPAGKDRYIIELESKEIGDKFYASRKASNIS